MVVLMPASLGAWPLALYFTPQRGSLDLEGLNLIVF